MKISFRRILNQNTAIRNTVVSLRKSLLVAVALFVGSVALDAMAQVHQFPNSGLPIRIEGEDYSAASESYPFAVNCDACSGDRTLGYYWSNSWFDLEVNVPEMLNYHISLRAASPSGTTIEVEMIDDLGAVKLTTISVPKTGSWTAFQDTVSVTMSLPAGVRVLRFRNMVDGANIDYITVKAGTPYSVGRAAPTPNAGPGINPLKGFGSSWWRPNEDHASVGFQYIEWGRFEPQDGVFDWDYVEEVLNRDGSRGRHIIVQFAVDWDDWGKAEPVGDSHYKGPDWLLTSVGENRGPAFPDDPNSRISRATRYNDPEFIVQATEAINTLFNGDGVHPGLGEDSRTFVLQVGLLGYWGEWHTYPRTDWGPTRQTKQTILDVYLNNLGHDGLTQVRYPDEPVNVPQKGMGYTNGSATPTAHGYEFGTAIADGELWKNGPVGGEWPPSIETSYWEKFFLTDEGKLFLRLGGYSTMTPPEAHEILAQLPGWTMDGLFMEMHKLMGYNFQANAIRHLVSSDESGLTHVEVDLSNVGIAPFYKDWILQLAILNAETGSVVEFVNTNFDLRTLGPNELTTVADSFCVELHPDVNYQIGLRILQPGADMPKTCQWKLNARNAYVVLANNVEVVEGVWDEDNALRGGWNILDTVDIN